MALSDFNRTKIVNGREAFISYPHTERRSPCCPFLRTVYYCPFAHSDSSQPAPADNLPDYAGDNGIFYSIPAASIPQNSALTFAESDINSASGAITFSAPGAVFLASGQYGFTLTADASAADGAASATVTANLAGADLGYLSSSVPLTDGRASRIVISGIVNAAEPGSTLTFYNRSELPVDFSNTTLTVIKLA